MSHSYSEASVPGFIGSHNTAYLHQVSKRKSAEPFGMKRTKYGTYTCGACGITGKMTAAHVPPQGAGNAGPVRATTAIITPTNEVKYYPPRQGGMLVYGLCEPCNNAAGVHYDRGYIEFANLLRPHWIRDWRLALPHTIQLPDGQIEPGTVARSILLGMAALTPTWMFDNWSNFLMDLLDPKSATALPDDVHLMMAYSRGRTGRAEGFATTIIGSRDTILTSFASVYYAPLAWQLVDSESARLLRQMGWADVSSWIGVDVGEVRDLRSLVRAMTATSHPLHDPNWANGYYAHMSSSEVSLLVETHDVLGGSGLDISDLQRHLKSQVYLPLPDDEPLTLSGSRQRE